MEYENGEDESYISEEAEQKGDPDVYEEKYDSHQDVMQMLSAAQWADHDNREGS